MRTVRVGRVTASRAKKSDGLTGDQCSAMRSKRVKSSQVSRASPTSTCTWVAIWAGVTAGAVEGGRGFVFASGEGEVLPRKSYPLRQLSVAP